MKFNPKVPIESVFDINTDPQIWNPIVGFRGYEVSNKGNVRSLKFYKEYPYGVLLSPCKNDGKYILSDNHNVRRKLSLQEIYKMRDVTNVTYTCTICNGFDARIQRHFINFETVREEEKIEHEVYRVPVPVNRDKLYMPHFTIIDDDGKKIINPITFYDSFNL